MAAQRESLAAKWVDAINRPGQTFRYARRKLAGGIAFAAVGEARSDSDDGNYIAFVERAVASYSVFRNFKRDPRYRVVLEHVNEAEGAQYLETVRAQTPNFLDQVEKFKINDRVGNPITFRYGALGWISPTTLRYMKVASDLMRYFGADIGAEIVEIGIGYAGQLLVNDQVFRVKRHHLYDLPPVLDLARKCLESHILNCAYATSTLNQNTGDDRYDLCISNYAFSELPAPLQLKYIEKILSKCRRGYLTMNTGRGNAPRTVGKLSLTQLRELLPSFEVVEERPLSSPDNYIILWGHQPERV